MQIRHDSDMVKNFAEIMLSQFYDEGKTNRPKGFHRSDAISCPLKPYWRITKLIVQEFSTRSVGILLLGTLAHIAMHKYFDAQEKVYEIGGTFVTVDALYGEFPIETKTTRMKVYGKEDLPQEWIEQLAIAMAVMKVNKGYLMVMNIITFTLMVWEITITDEEREMFLQSYLWQVMSIADAIDKKKPELLVPKYQECFGCGYNHKNGCPFCKVIPRK